MLKIAPLLALCIAFALSSAVNGSDENVVQGQRVKMSVAVTDYTTAIRRFLRATQVIQVRREFVYAKAISCYISCSPTIRTSRDTKAIKEPRVQQEIADKRHF